MATKFQTVLADHNIHLTRNGVQTLQVNIGKRCNQACSHCHVESSPTRTENMEKETIDRLIHLLQQAPQVHTVDITGGAPELNPHFKYFVRHIRQMGKRVIDRCNLTILFEADQENTADFLADNQVEIVASLPCYMQDNVDKQRGKGVFGKSIEALRLLNRLGYAQPGSGLKLNLVYNPVGPHLPPAQAPLKLDYQRHLQNEFNIQFNDLFTITNMPIKRYSHFLRRLNQWDAYMQLLIDNFNPAAASGVMCKNLVSIGWDGRLYDCDFNQMLDIPLKGPAKTIWDIQSLQEVGATISLADHCFGCTAGAGSSCGGALVD